MQRSITLLLCACCLLIALPARAAGTIADKLAATYAAVTNIGAAISEKGVSTNGYALADYADLIRQIQGGTPLYDIITVTGGIKASLGDEVLVTFAATNVVGTVVASEDVVAEYLICGGGGAGGYGVSNYGGGGGGGGGVVTGAVELAAHVTAFAVVGAGGGPLSHAGYGNNYPLEDLAVDGNGHESSLTVGASVLTAHGGGAGGSQYAAASGATGGGAGGRDASPVTAESLYPLEGGNGGTYGRWVTWGAGNGGGGAGPSDGGQASGREASGTSYAVIGGDGGDGRASSITGELAYYGGGGGGGGKYMEASAITGRRGMGGLGGGGDGGYNDPAAPEHHYPQDGVDGLGGGGGGSDQGELPGSPKLGAHGGSGVVILRIRRRR